MRILFMPSWYEMDDNSSNGIFFTEQAKALQEKGNDVVIAIVDVLNYPYKCKTKKYRIIKEKRHGIDVYRIVVPSFFTGHFPCVFFSYYAHYYKKLYRALLSEGFVFDIIYAHSFWHAGYIATILKNKYHIPLIVQEHRSMIINGGFSKRVNTFLKKTVEKADLFFCVSSVLRDKIYTRTGLKDGIELLPNMVSDLFKFKPLMNSVFTFSFIGTLDENKRVIQLIRCFETLLKRYPDINLKIAGDGPLKEQITMLINDSNLLSKTVSFLGPISRNSVYDLLANTNVLILPSAFETFGVVCIEAMAVGRPVICTKNGSVDYINEDNGILIDVDSDYQLIQAMEKTIKYYPKYNLRSISDSCLNHYSSTVVISKLISNMASVILENPGSGDKKHNE